MQEPGQNLDIEKEDKEKVGVVERLQEDPRSERSARRESHGTWQGRQWQRGTNTRACG